MRIRRSILVTAVMAVLLEAAAAWSAELAVGVATADITPPRGYRMAGYFRERANTGTKDPLQAKAMVLHQGEFQMALVFCDLVGISRDVAARARALAAEKTGIPARQIAICATHSHTGPLYFGALRRHFHDKAVAANGRDAREELDYPATLSETLASVIAKAQSDLAPARLAAGVAHQEGLSFNRRFHMKNGTVVFNPGQKNPNIARAAGPIDPDVGILTVFGANAQSPRAALTVFALHLDTVGGTEYSADYPYFLESALRQELGPRFHSLFGAGTCGDVNHIDVETEGRRTAKEIGTTLARTVLAQLPKLELIPSPDLKSANAIVDVPLQHFGEDETNEARARLDEVGQPSLPFLAAVRAVKLVDLRDNYPGATLGLEVQAFRISPDLAIVTLPGEIFVELGLGIKKASPFKTTLVIELANSAPAYIPTKKAFGEGSYEIVNSRVESGGGEALVETATRLLKELARSPE